MPRCWVLASCVVDWVFRVPRLPHPGESVLAEAPKSFLGGKGANQAVAAARAGADVAIIGAVGRDEEGDRFVSLFRREGIDVTHLVRVPERTGIAAVTVGPDGLNQISIHPGANMVLPESTVANAPIKPKDLILGQLEVPDACLLTAARRGRFILNPAPYRDFAAELLANCEICIPNESEAAAITGIEPVDEETANKSVLAIAGPKAMILTLGKRGAILAQANEVRGFSAPGVEAVDSTGAGDVFCGSLLARLAADDQLSDAIAYAVTSASISVTRPGAINSIPTATEVRDFLVARKI